MCLRVSAPRSHHRPIGIVANQTPEALKFHMWSWLTSMISTQIELTNIQHMLFLNSAKSEESPTSRSGVRLPEREGLSVNCRRGGQLGAAWRPEPSSPKGTDD